MKIVFLDIDGPMIPYRAYWMPNQTRPWVTVFDPAAVGLLNNLCEASGAQIAVHSSWRKTGLHGVDNLVDHFVAQGIERDHFHDSWNCPMKLSSNRWQEITFFLEDMKDAGTPVTDYVILEDEPLPYGYEDHEFQDRLCKIDFNEGFTLERYVKALDILGAADTKLGLSGW